MGIGLKIKELRKKLKLSQVDFSSKINIDNSQLSKIERGNLQPTITQLMDISSNFNVSVDYLLSNKVANTNSNNSIGIPLIPVDAMAGFGTGTIQVMDYDTERYNVPEFTELNTDFMIRVKGSSMYPKYNSGDVVACKKLPLDTFFQWNKVYVLDTIQGAMIKRIHQSKKQGYITCFSDNEKYKPFDISLQDVYSLALVVGVIRLE